MSKKSPKERSSKTRRRKTADEINLLERAFAKDPEWTEKTVTFVVENTGLDSTQIYKWGWDQKKKIKKNPNLKIVPTIDEFGGYCKYNHSDANLLALCDEDLNHKIALLDQECERECGPLPDYNPRENALKRRKTVDFENVDQNIQNQGLQESPCEETDSFFAPLKKVKRDRYCSDLTNVTRSPALAPSVHESNLRGGFEDEFPSEKVEFCFDSGDMLDNDNSFGFVFNSGNLFLQHK